MEGVMELCDWRRRCDVSRCWGFTAVSRSRSRCPVSVRIDRRSSATSDRSAGRQKLDPLRHLHHLHPPRPLHPLHPHRTASIFILFVLFIILILFILILHLSPFHPPSSSSSSSSSSTMSGSKEEEDRKGSGEWREAFWNPRTHELLGRTATSWGLILLFYLVFYLFLAGMFTLTMYIMLLTLDDYKPTWQDRLETPGMMIRPKGDQLDLTFSVSNTESWDDFVQNLNSFLSTYNDTFQVQTNDNCPPDQYFIQEDSAEVRNNPKRSCQFNRTILDECSGIFDRYYGYDKGQPCVLIKLNRVIGMLPGKDGQSPYVTCGAKREDADKIGPLAYFPPNGTFNLMYYPYYGKRAQVNYTQPLVAVKFLNASLNTDINVECRVNSNTLSPGSERDKFAGRVSFKLRINDK